MYGAVFQSALSNMYVGQCMGGITTVVQEH